MECYGYACCSDELLKCSSAGLVSGLVSIVTHADELQSINYIEILSTDEQVGNRVMCH